MSATEHLPILPPAECACDGGTLDKLIQPAILAMLGKGPLHGYGLAERLGKMKMFGGQPPDVSGIYRFLKVMETQGLVDASWCFGERGPAKKSYRLTSAGEQCLGRWIETLENHRRGLNEILHTAKTVAESRKTHPE
jgi:DNA-binding PadR family transcriptional regulator